MPDAGQHGRKEPAGNRRARWPLPAIPAAMARRGVRAGIVIPAVFAIGEQLLRNSNVALFAAFGSVTMLLFVEFGGPMRRRLMTHAAFVVATMIPVTLGTAAPAPRRQPELPKLVNTTTELRAQYGDSRQEA